MSSSFVRDLYDFLKAENLNAGVPEWTVLRHRLRDDIGRQIVITSDGGGLPQTPSYRGVGQGSQETPGVQVLLRGVEHEGDEVEAKAQEIKDHLHGLLRVTLSGTLYRKITALTSAPIFVGWDDRERATFTVAFRGQRDVEVPLSMQG